MKLKKINYLQKFMFLFCTILGVYSCTTSNEDKIESEETILSLNEIESIGRLHNEYLASVYQNFNFASENKMTDLKNNLISLPISEISNTEKSDIVNSMFQEQSNRSSSTNDIEVIKASLESDLAKNIIDLAYGYLNSLEHHEDLVNEYESLKTNTYENLSGNDYNGVLSYLIVIEQSSYFWKETEFGGSGEGYSILLSLQNQGQAARGVSPCTRAVIAADGAGAATAVLGAGIGGWIAGAFNPAAAAATVALAAAAASVIASNVHYACHDEDGDGNPNDS